MSSKPVINIEECKPREGETYGSLCDRMEEIVGLIITTKDNSLNGVITLAHIMMEAPADFGPELFKNTRVFLSTLSDEHRKLFQSECEKHPRRYDLRIKSLLTIVSSSNTQENLDKKSPTPTNLCKMEGCNGEIVRRVAGANSQGYFFHLPACSVCKTKDIFAGNVRTVGVQEFENKMRNITFNI